MLWGASLSFENETMREMEFFRVMEDALPPRRSANVRSICNINSLTRTRRLAANLHLLPLQSDALY